MIDIQTILEKNSEQEFTPALEKYNTEQLITFKTTDSGRRVCILENLSQFRLLLVNTIDLGMSLLLTTKARRPSSSIISTISRLHGKVTL